jgi:hypothetical protein
MHSSSSTSMRHNVSLLIWRRLSRCWVSLLCFSANTSISYPEDLSSSSKQRHVAGFDSEELGKDTINGETMLLDVTRNRRSALLVGDNFWLCGGLAVALHVLFLWPTKVHMTFYCTALRDVLERIHELHNGIVVSR